MKTFLQALFFFLLVTQICFSQVLGSFKRGYEISTPKKNLKLVLDPLPGGTYSVGSGGDFPSIDSAFNKLSIDGIAGEVTLELINNLYTAPADTFGFVLNGPISGAGPNSRVIIKPAANTNVTIEGNLQFVLSFNDISYLTLDGVGTEGTTTLTVHSIFNQQIIENNGIVVVNNSDHNIIQNVVIICEDISRTGIGIFFACTINSTFVPDSNLIQNNFIKKAGAAIVVSAYWANPDTKHRGNVIKENKVGSETDSLIAWGIQIEKSQNAVAENNIVQNLKLYNNNTWDGVNKGINSYWGTGDTIRNNIVHNFKSLSGIHSTGIQLSGDVGKTGSGNMVYNNMIYDIQSTSTWPDSRVAGIQIWQQNNPNIFYNSVYLSGTGANHQGSAAFYIHHSCSNVTLKNNILVNTRVDSPYCATAIYDHTATNLTSDNNILYYAPNQNNSLVRIGITRYNTLVDWQVTTNDLQSYIEMPHFIEPFLHIDDTIATYIESRGTPIPGIDMDFDGQTRNTLTPDIGADELDGVVGVEDQITLPTEFSLSQNYPNPFNPSTTINYSIAKMSKVTLTLYNLLGEEVKTLINEEKPTGNYSVEFNAVNLPSGVYFYQLQAVDPSTSSGQGFVETKKMILIK